MHPEGVVLIATVTVVIGILIVRRRGEKLRLPIATLALALVTLVMGALVVIDPELLLVIGGDYGSVVDFGEWWRIVTVIFAQEPAWFPVAFNVIALVVVGSLFESIFGWRMLLVTFFATGIVGAVFGLLIPAGFTGNSVANNGLAGMLAVVALTLPPPARALGVLSIAAALFLYARGLFVFAFADLHGIGHFVGVAIGVAYVVIRWVRVRPRRSRLQGVPA